MADNDDSLIEALNQANAGVAPSPFGRLELTIPGSPASVQSAKDVRDAYISSIKAALAHYKFVLTGQLVLDIV